MPTRTVANIKRTFYQVMHRAPATFTVPGTGTDWTTLLGTMTDLGIARDRTIKIEITKGDTEPLDTGKEKIIGYSGLFECVLLQSEPADYTSYETIENVEQDLLIYSTANSKAIFVPNAILSFDESVISGETEAVTARYESANVLSKAAFRTRFAIPS